MERDGNIFAGLSAAAPFKSERIDELLVRPGATIERIVSKGHKSPPGFWYDQDWDEWVIVLSGEARLRFEEEMDARVLAAGDYVFIPAKTRHRVDRTTEDQTTVWLAVHLGRKC
jgi:cupin 2 domain-containing protein